MLVAKITAEKAEELKGQYFDSAGKFSPVKDGLGNDIITFPEAQYLDGNDIEVIEYIPPQQQVESDIT